MTDYTTAHRHQLEAYLASHPLPAGLGNTKSACTLAAINLAMSGRLTDAIPDCMSEVLGRAAIGLQDAMPDEARNSPRYKALIPDMPGTGRDQEKERLAILMDWMWTTMLPQLQPIADRHGFGDQWRRMCKEQTVASADAAARVARAARAADYAVAAALAVRVAARVARAADYAVAAALAVASADAAVRVARAAEYAADYAANAADADAAGADFWTTIDPIGVLERMTYLGGDKP